MSTPRELVVAAAQMQSQDDVAANLACAAELCAKAKRRGAELVLLPENFAFMGAEAERRSIAEPVALGAPAGAILRALADVARHQQLTIIAGGMPEASQDPSRPYNSSVVLSPRGEVLAVYRKIHLFDVDVGDGQSYRESLSTTPGEQAKVIELGGASVGLSVCYDVRFPELYRALADRGAQIATVPAAFTLMTGKDHWHVLLRARAIESQLFVVAAAQCGSHPRDRRTYGKSCVIDPWGDVIAQASDGVGLVTAVLELDRVDAVRKSLPSLTHRRPIA